MQSILSLVNDLDIENNSMPSAISNSNSKLLLDLIMKTKLRSKIIYSKQENTFNYN